jgi:patatin-like phospholipase/acyl hydrolase
MSSYRILSLDGGGIRGLLTVILLERLEAAHAGLLAQVDLFAGTSTGGVLALGLAAGFSPSEGRKLYEEKGAFVFADSVWDDLLDLGTAMGAQYSNDNLKKVLLEQFGDQTLGDLPKKVLISSFDLDNEAIWPGAVRTWKPKFFHNYPGPDSDADQRVVDVALRTSAAPVYFPIYQGYIDGGVVANNPSMCALAQALDKGTGRQRVEDVVLLSVSTGRNPQFLDVGHADWGWTQWVVDLRLINVMLGGNVGLADYQCQRVLGERYHRLDPVLPEAIDLDDVKQIPRLKELAMQADLARTLVWLEQNFSTRKLSDENVLRS